MTLMEITQAMGSVAVLTIILFGSLWLKRHLKGYH